MTAGTMFETTPTAYLSRQDRCDRCGARAYVKATLGDDLELLFCGHHFRDHEIKLAASGAVILDERHRIDEQRADV